jgi:hypothetical protein
MPEIPKQLCYTELQKRTAFLSRFKYLMLGGELGAATFGYDRHLNQAFYSSAMWKSVRDQVIVRDDGCDLGMLGHGIHDRILVHHMNPIRVQDLTDFNEDILDPEYLICVSTRTHNAIHFGDEKQLPRPFIERTPGDTDLW